MNGALTPRRILIADDYQDLAERMRQLLELVSSEPLTTAVVINGAQAAEHAAARPPDVALLDIDMPLKNGIDAAIAIRAALPRCLVVIVVTGNFTNLERIVAAAVFDYVLGKPFEADEVLRVLRSSCVGRLSAEAV